MTSFKELLHNMTVLDEALIAAIDPAKLIGEVKGKVAGIHAVINRLENDAKSLDIRRKKLSAAVKALKRNAKSLKEYTAFEMEMNHFEMLPGEGCYVRLQEAGETLQISRAPSFEDLEAYSPYIERREVLLWREDRIEQALKTGDELSFASFQRTKYAKFYDGIPKAKRNAISADLPADAQDHGGNQPDCEG